MRRRPRFVALPLVVLPLLVLLTGAGPVGAARSGEIALERYLAQVRDDPARLRELLYDFPKGADLHTHLSGAVSTESLIRYAAGDGMCIHVVTYVAALPPCVADQRPAADAVDDPAFRAQVIGSWSMEGFQPGLGESGHDHFFAAFGKFGAVSDRHRPEMLAEVAEKAAKQNEIYMETMTTRQGGPVFAVSEQVAFDEDFAKMHRAVLAGGGLAQAVAQAVAETDADEAQVRDILACGTPQASKGCDLTLRYIHQVNRRSAPNVVFTFMVYGFELAEADGRNVALNLVAPEDGAVALRDYGLHMRMLDYLRGLYQRGHITLHAGELTPALVAPEHLRSHIRDAVVVGHAERIGHGVDVLGEDRAPELLRLMAERHVMVEAPLTSNAQILEVSGWRHPFPVYRAVGVPVALATDDEGISRADLTADFERAVTSYFLRYRDLKKLARTSVHHAFLDGPSLWRGPDDFRPGPACAGDRLGGLSPSATCASLLASSPKAALEWQQEGRFSAFEAGF